jgi:hypothetical protein
MPINETPVRKSGVSQSRMQNLWGGLRQGFRRRMLGRKLGPGLDGGSSETNNVTNAPSTNSIGLSNLGAGAELYAQLKSELESIANFQRSATGAFGHRLDQLVEIDREIEALLIKLFQPDIAEKWQGNLGLRAAFARRLAQISTRLAIAYRELLDEGRRKYPPGSRGTQRLPAIACRAIMQIGLSMRWHCHANKREPSTSWGRLYRLYRFVEKRGIVGEKIAFNDRANTTCHQEFARIILFGLADPAGLSPEMIDAAYAWCGQWSNLVEFAPPASVEGEQHCFDMEGNLPPSQFHPQMQSDRMRCFSTAAVCFKVVSVRERPDNIVGGDRTVQVGKQGAIVRPGAYQHPAHGLSNLQRDNLIRHLMNGWVKARPARRVDRESDGLKVARVACGADAINELLYAESKPDSGIPAEFSFEHWSIENESSSGYGLRKKKVSEDPEAGKLVCLRVNGSPIWRVGVVRWQRSAETGEPQLGIETLADNPKVVHLSLAPGINGGLPKTQTMNPTSPAGSDIGEMTGIATGLLPAEIAELARRGTKIPDIHFAQNGLPHNLSRQSPQTAQARQTSATVIKALLLPRDASRGTAHSLVISGQSFTVGTVLKISSDAAENSKFWIRLNGVVDYTDKWAQMSFAVMSRAQ